MNTPVEMLSVAFTTLGCKANHAESERIAAELLGRGVCVTSADAADVVIIDTCTITGEADAKARKAVRRALGRVRGPVVVTGCLAALDADGLRALDPRVIVEADKARVAEKVCAALGVSTSAAPTPARVGDTFRTRATVKIQDGCDAFCAYCIVPYARGVPRSVALSETEREVDGLVNAGVAEIVLSGINLGRYESEGCDLADLVRLIDARGVRRLRLSSIEPPDLTERLAAALGEAACTCTHLHVPLQSGSDVVLSAMGRSYTLAAYERAIARMREALPGLAVTTDVIAGFPGETGGDAELTERACARIGFSKLHVFRYSAREGTPAAAMTQVPAPVRAERARRLRTLGDRLREQWLARLVGSDLEVLVERIDAPSGSPATSAISDVASDAAIAEGVSREYARVRIVLPPGVSPASEPAPASAPRSHPRPGDVIRVRAEALGEGGVLLGRVEETGASARW